MQVAACDAVISFPLNTPTCSGNWSVIEVSTSLSPFDPSTLDPALLAEAFGAGLIILGTMLVFVRPLKDIVNFIKGA